MTSRILQRLVAAIRAFPRRFAADSAGNVLMIMGFAILPLTFAVGMGIDYSRAEKLQTKLNAAADAAVLAAVDASMMQQSDANAQAAAYAMFKSQVTGLNGLIITLPASATFVTSGCSSDGGYQICYTPAGALNSGRTITVTYTAQSQNLFSAILGKPTLAITGTSTANAAVAPYINFYLVLDTSPSMLLPSTSAGLTNIRTATSTTNLPNGCDFACHNANPHNDNIYVQNSSGQNIWLDSSGNWHAVVLLFNNGDVCTANCGTNTGSEPRNAVIAGNTSNAGSQYADGVWLTQNYSTLYPGGGTIDLRLNDETDAAQQLIPFATTQAVDNQVTYKMQIFGFGTATTALTSSMVNVNTMSASSVPNLLALQPLWWENNQMVQGVGNNDEATSFSQMLTSMNTTMPNPGTGQTASSPEEVMFIITDGMDDEADPATPLGTAGDNVGGSRWIGGLATSEISQCATIKSRGIKIAILYTQYLPDALTGDSWSQTYVASYVANVQPQLVQCASTASDGTPLVYTVTTDQNIATALQALFALTVQAAHLLQ